MTTPKLIALDLDGTTLRSDKTLSPAVAAAIEHAARAGARIVPATGRVRSMVFKQITGLRGVSHIITSNGAAVYELASDQRRFVRAIPPEPALAILDLLAPLHLSLEAYVNGAAYICSDCLSQPDLYLIPPQYQREFSATRVAVPDLRAILRQHPEGVEKFNLLFLTDVVRRQLWATLEGWGSLCLTCSMQHNIEINARGVDKGSALRLLCESLGVAPKEVLAIGDSENDLGMLDFAGISFSMGNAVPQVKRHAGFSTRSNDEDGVAVALGMYFPAKL